MLRPGMLKRFPVKLTRTHIVTALPSSSTRLGLLLMAEANEFLLSLIDFYHTSRSVVQDFDQHPQGIFSESFPIQKKTNLTSKANVSQHNGFAKEYPLGPMEESGERHPNIQTTLVQDRSR